MVVLMVVLMVGPHQMDEHCEGFRDKKYLLEDVNLLRDHH